MDRREFIKITGIAGAGLFLPTKWLGTKKLFAALPGGTLDPTLLSKYVSPLAKPPVFARTAQIKFGKLVKVQYYELAVRQFQQQILPAGQPKTTVWSYGPANDPRTVAQGGQYFYPAFTIENQWLKPTAIKWVNGLVDANGNYLPHFLPIDQTLHWANPPGGTMMRDMRGSDPTPYLGPVPIVTHVHGAHTTEESDGYAEAWYLPDARNIPGGYARTGTFYDYFAQKYGLLNLPKYWGPGKATFAYPNNQRATTLWYHDHTLGMTRSNVYAGPAGFYLIRGGPSDAVGGKLPGPAPGVGSNPFGTFYEIPLAIQDRAFNADGSLFYPDHRAFFEGLNPAQLQIPFIPEEACDGLASDVSPIWNPEFFGNTMVVNGQTWPYLEVEQRRYRFRFLNGCNSRFLILKMDNGLPFYQIGAEGGFLPTPVQLDQLLLSPAERADVIVDFTNVPVGTEIILLNLGPDAPFAGGVPGVDFDPADPSTTGQVMQFRVISSTGVDTSTPPMRLRLPAVPALGASVTTRQVSLNEEESRTVRASEDGSGNIVLDCENGAPFGPTAALLGTLTPTGTGAPLMWMDNISENPGVGDTETWEIHNFTMDSHPIHVHQVQFQVVNRENKMTGMVRGPEPWEMGYKDTVIAYPDEITRIKAKFDLPGFYVWHCHIVEHEDNEMMRPFHVGPIPANAPAHKASAGNATAEAKPPREFVLEQNYPNPFNPSTNIRFQMPAAEQVELRIFNALGQEVRTLANGRFEAGRHTSMWDGRDNQGRTVASGIYICRMTAGKFTQSRLMNLIR